MHRKIDYAAQIARGFVGCPYVFAATGAECTPKFRRNRAEARPEYKEIIFRNCPVLSGKQANCASCKYEGKPAFDCRGLTYRVCKEAGIKISSVGATTQWNSDDWIEKGSIENMPFNIPCCVFKQDRNDKRKMLHTGFYLGDGNTVDSRGHATGTVESPTASYPWTHYAIPKGAYDEIGTSPNTQPGSGNRPTIRKGDTGETVKIMQHALLEFGCALPKYGADGDFGNETLAALKAFQAASELTVDGICGPATWTKLELFILDQEQTPKIYTVVIKNLDAEAATYLLESYPGATATEENG